jgi:DNA-binding NtrC family response regulator
MKLTGHTSRPRILVVDDDPIAADSLAEFLQTESGGANGAGGGAGGPGFDALAAFNGEEALRLLDEAANPTTPGIAPRPFAVVICDVAMPRMDGIEALKRIVKSHPTTVVLMLTGYGSIEAAVQAVRLGAVDYLTKPIVDTELRYALERAMRQHALLAENRSLKAQLDDRHSLNAVVGSDHRMVKVFELIQAVAPSKTTVLMTGESGVGKSLVAHAIHKASPRAGKPFVELACGSIPETLLESELFGHVKGAFTGAHADKAGRFLAASGGTIFLDEINSASPGMQLKLLRVLQERRFEPVGSNQTVEADVRVVLASNQPLEQLVAQGTFRQDLYYRINVVKIELPPLRDRSGDIPLLAHYFLRVHSTELGKQITGISEDAMAALVRYPFPGNVRELQNLLERAAVLSRTPTIQLHDLPDHVIASTPGLAFPGGSGRPDTSTAAPVEGPWVPMPLEHALREPERRIILKALEANNWNRQKTAEDLKINRTTLYKKMKQLGIEGAERLAG